MAAKGTQSVNIKQDLLKTLHEHAASFDMDTTAYVHALLYEALRSGKADALVMAHGGTFQRRARRNALRWVAHGGSQGRPGFKAPPAIWVYVDEATGDRWELHRIGRTNVNRPETPKDGWWLWRYHVGMNVVGRMGFSIKDAKRNADAYILSGGRINPLTSNGGI